MTHTKVLTRLAIVLLAGSAGVGSLVLGQMTPPHQPGTARQERAGSSISGQNPSSDGLRRHFNIDLNDLRTKARQHASIRVQGIPIAKEQMVDLHLRRFWITTPETLFVTGRKGGRDERTARWRGGP